MEQPAPPLTYSIVIATFERPEELEITLASIAAQTLVPVEVIVADSSNDDRTKQLTERWKGPCPIVYLRTEERGAARQRNEGAGHVERANTSVFAFIDDDMTLSPETCEKILQVFAADADHKIGGIAARMEDLPRPVPRGGLWWYYRIQAGYSHPTYGGQVFGPAINCLPCYTDSESTTDLIPANWLNSGCVFYRYEVFWREKFPKFEGYSSMEDVHLSALVARTHQLYFHKMALCRHRDAPNELKRDVRGIARQRMRNQKIVSVEVLAVRGLTRWWKILLHKIFVSVAVIRRGDPSWKEELCGTWL